MATDNQTKMQTQLAKLLERERAITAQASKLKKEMAEMDRKTETRYLCILGRAWLELGKQSSEGTRSVMQKFLHGYIQPKDIEILRGTAWAVNVPAPEILPADPHEATYEPDDSQYA